MLLYKDKKSIMVMVCCDNLIEAFTYDADGNLLTDGTSAYSWDGENRLVKVEPIVAETAATYEYDYDYMGRRAKTTYTASNGTTFFEQTFIYDGWNLALFDWSIIGTSGMRYSTFFQADG